MKIWLHVVNSINQSINRTPAPVYIFVPFLPEVTFWVILTARYEYIILLFFVLAASGCRELDGSASVVHSLIWSSFTRKGDDDYVVTREQD